MSVEYAPKGLVGVLTPQANTTVEPEYAILTPPGYAFINARMLSAHKTIEERLLDYFANLHTFSRQFANAPIGALAFACTGTSYLVGKDVEDRTLGDVSRILKVPVVSAATAVVMALKALNAKRIGLVSPYTGALDAACTPYWKSRGFDIAVKTSAARPGDNFHPIYSLPSGAARLALEEIKDLDLDAIVMLGTGMPTLAPIAQTPFHGRAPVLSCMFCLIWAGVMLLDNAEPSAENVKLWLTGDWWKRRVALAALSA
ncbi:MAG: maleate cis-trans isomerase family protein [Xanthobacteraceae bacterium]